MRAMKCLRMAGRAVETGSLCLIAGLSVSPVELRGRVGDGEMDLVVRG